MKHLFPSLKHTKNGVSQHKLEKATVRD